MPNYQMMALALGSLAIIIVTYDLTVMVVEKLKTKRSNNPIHKEEK